MANKSKKRQRGGGGRTADEAPAEAPRKAGGRVGRKVLGVVAVLAIGVGAFVGWHRRQDPARKWARALERSHATSIEAPLARCFGGHSATAIRALLPEVRRGQLPRALRTCRGPIMSEVVVAPMAFLPSLGDPPAAAESAKVRERDKLERLRVSLQALQRVLEDLPAQERVPEARRDTLVSALEDVAVDVDGERTSFNDLVQAAESGGSIW